MLLDQIKKDSLVARKARETDKATLLSTLYSEASMVGKNDGNRESTDAEVVQVVKKFIKGIDEILTRSASELGLSSTRAKAIKEKEILETYLPQQLSEEELAIQIDAIIVKQHINEIKKMGLVMKTLKERFDGQYDGKVASEIIKGRLS